jgi:uncharacterized protein YjcR
VDAWATAADLARLYCVSRGTIYAWASQDGWRRRGKRPKKYAWEDAQASYEKRHVRVRLDLRA